jgi:radical SAM protein with 4Fe4S-binding SPASM domain
MAKAVEEEQRVEFTLDSRPYAPPEIFSKKIESGIWILLDPEMPNWVAVDALGKEIVELCNGERSLEEVTEILCAKHNGDLGSSKDNIVEFANMLAEKEFLSSEPYAYSCPNKSNTKISHLWINITNRCNLRCIHCFRAAGEALDDELATEEIFKIIDEFKELGGREMVISGGEPFIRRDTIDILKYAKGKSLAITLITNGVLVTSEIAQCLKELEPITIQVSIDSVIEATHDKIRGKGSFQQAIRGIRYLRKAGFSQFLVMAMTVMKLNKSEIEDFVKLAVELGASMVHFPTFQALGRGRENQNLLGLNIEELKEAYQQIASMQRKYVGVINFSLGAVLKYIKRAPRDHCGAGVSHWNIEPDGWVTPCAGLTADQFSVGNIREQSLRELVSNSRLTREFRSMHVKQNSACAICELRFICGGGCHVDKYIQYGGLEGVDPKCEALKEWFWRLLRGEVIGAIPEKGFD